MDNPIPDPAQPVAPISPKVNSIDLLKSTKGSLKDYLSMVLNLNESGVFLEPTCMFCCSKTRIEAEAAWRGIVALPASKEVEVRKIFLSVGEDVPIEVIRHHIKNHLDRAEAELRKIETINKISALNSVKVSTLDQIQLLQSACMERLMAIAEMQAPNASMRNIVEGQKNKDTATIIKTMQGLLSLQAAIMGEMKGRGELLSIPVDKFKEVFAKNLANLQTKEEKFLVMGIMEELTKANTI